jgi:DNA-binding response OmpR family regulator
VTKTDSNPIILVVDDEEPMRSAIGRILSRANYVHFEASDPNAALGLADLYPFALVLCDINMPGGSGLEMLRALRRLHPDIAVVMVSGIADRATTCARSPKLAFRNQRKSRSAITETRRRRSPKVALS